MKSGVVNPERIADDAEIVETRDRDDDPVGVRHRRMHRSRTWRRRIAGPQDGPECSPPGAAKAGWLSEQIGRFRFDV